MSPCAVEARERLIYLIRAASARSTFGIGARTARLLVQARTSVTQEPAAAAIGGALGNILGRYVLREVVTAWLVVTSVLLVILLANEVVGVLERAAANQYPQSVVLELIGLGALQYLSVLLPVGLLLGVVLAFGRLYHDSEMAAAFACGAGPGMCTRRWRCWRWRWRRCSRWLTLVVAPQATAAGAQPAQCGAARRAARADRLGQVPQLRRRRQCGGVRAERGARRHARQCVRRAQQRTAGGGGARAARPHAVTADGMTHILTLYDGERFEGVPGSAEFRIVRFAEHVVPVQVPALTDVVRDLEAVPTASLRDSRTRRSAPSCTGGSPCRSCAWCWRCSPCRSRACGRARGATRACGSRC